MYYLVEINVLFGPNKGYRIHTIVFNNEYESMINDSRLDLKLIEQW